MTGGLKQKQKKKKKLITKRDKDEVERHKIIK